MSSPPERYRIKCQAASHPGAAFSFAALAFPACPHRTTHPHRAVTPVPCDVTPPSSDTTSLSEEPPNLLWYTGTLRVEIADSGNSPCEIAVFRSQNDHLARGIPDNGYFNPCFGAWRRLSGLGMVSLRSRSAFPGLCLLAHMCGLRVRRAPRHHACHGCMPISLSCRTIRPGLSRSL